MAVSEAHKKASYKYNANRDSITIRPERSKGAAIRAAAVASGKSLQNYILDALNARMEQEGQPLEIEQTPAVDPNRPAGAGLLLSTCKQLNKCDFVG